MDRTRSRGGSGDDGQVGKELAIFGCTKSVFAYEFYIGPILGSFIVVRYCNMVISTIYACQTLLYQYRRWKVERSSREQSSVVTQT